MSAHTPGPWRAVTPENGHRRPTQIRSDRNSIASTAFAPDLSTDEIIANARLIAAAPELLEAVYSAIAHFADTSARVRPLNDAERAELHQLEAVADKVSIAETVEVSR